MKTIFALILFPLVIAAILLFIKSDKVRKPIVIGAAAILAIGSIVTAVRYLGKGSVMFTFNSEIVSLVLLGIDVLIGVYIFHRGIKGKNPLAVVLALIQTFIVIFMELGPLFGKNATHSLYMDTLSIIMILVIGIIGSAICVYALGYMSDFAKHHEHEADRRPMFFALMFAFLGAMFGIVTTNNMTWMLCAWEITTVCSFILIGYTQTEEAERNAFRQINMNLLGGIAFSIAILCAYYMCGSIDFDVLIQNATGHGFAAIAIPITLLAFAGCTKAAQMPFQSWLLGAMVAPTPVSALLHSSTMVKAGVFLVIKLAVCLGPKSVAGLMVMFVGGITFAFCAILAITQSNAKRVLAYSTISNLGLIIACAGIGSAEAIWAAIFLLIFHAAAKSLLFMAVGATEHRIGSRDIEDMDYLFARLPRMAKLMAIGIACMFIAPFGMLIAKWAALASFVDSGNLLLMLAIAFGSAATFFFWVKWLGKLIAVAQHPVKSVEAGVHKTEWVAIYLMAILSIGLVILIPLVSDTLVMPYLTSVFGSVSAALSQGNLIVMALMALFILIIFAAFPRKKNRKMQPVYMSGINRGGVMFENSLSGETEATQRNWYLEDYIDELRIGRAGEVANTVLFAFVIALLVIFAIGGVFK